ncbi:deleted in malignant brain tumors 1 protein-like [Patiria miniata]|uniref:Deleted in malignant brain tumors 1 protein-like n=1 Tax=Patiria miniata TaxID=46514 RepID=A0A914BGG4_PATMI|nr:deleted in malignant brain tumors 1 protein-like [Patiria miniata]
MITMKHPCSKTMLLQLLGVIVMTEVLFMLADASQLRLVGGKTRSQGRLEIFLNGEWGTVCDDAWDLEDAQVACMQLGFPGASEATQGGYFAHGTGQIHLDDVACAGYESDLLSCQHEGIGIHNCGHSEDAGVICNLRVRLVGGTNSMEGRVEVLLNGAWGTVCDDSWDLNDATVICRERGYVGAWEAPGSATFGEGDGLNILLDNVACLGNEETVIKCQHRGLGINDCSHSEDAGVRCFDLRLIGGSTSNEGRLEVRLNGEWGTVCDDLWDLDDARVACRQLGFPDATDATQGGSLFGSGSGSILLDNVECTGLENNLLSCQQNEIADHDCSHSEDAGVVCNNMGILRLVGGHSVAEGRLEIDLNGELGTVCDDSWGLDDAKVACLELGFPGAAEATPGGSYGSGSGPILLDDVMCSGFELQLLSCPHSGIGVNNCGHSEDAGVICQPRIHLVGGSSPNEGRVEVYENGAWGTVCDDGWDLTDANIVCRELGYDGATEALGEAAFGQGDGQEILLSSLNCVGSEQTVVDCEHPGLGIHSCGHGEDAGVRCADGCMLTVNASDVLMVVSSYQSVYLPGETIEYACPDGYHISGSASRFCQSDLTWSGQPAECITDSCVAGPCVNGGTCTSAPGEYTCLCPAGYDGMTCENVANCELIFNSSDVLIVVSGNRTVYLPGDSVEYACPDGYHLSGSATRYCRSDFTWSSPVAVCNQVANCELIFNSSDVLIVVSGNRTVYLPGDSVEYACPDGYHLSGSTTRYCRSDFTWSLPVAVCNQVMAAPAKFSLPVEPIIGGGAGGVIFIIMFFVALFAIKRRTARNHPVQNRRDATVLSCTVSGGGALPSSELAYQETILDDAIINSYADLPRRNAPLPPIPDKTPTKEACETYCNVQY